MGLDRHLKLLKVCLLPAVFKQVHLEEVTAKDLLLVGQKELQQYRSEASRYRVFHRCVVVLNEGKTEGA